MQITMNYATAVLSLADVTADAGVDRVTIDIPRDDFKYDDLNVYSRPQAVQKVLHEGFP